MRNASYNLPYNASYNLKIFKSCQAICTDLSAPLSDWLTVALTNLYNNCDCWMTQGESFDMLIGNTICPRFINVVPNSLYCHKIISKTGLSVQWLDTNFKIFRSVGLGALLWTELPLDTLIFYDEQKGTTVLLYQRLYKLGI